MKILHRIGYYIGGFSIGLLMLAFFINKSGTSCSYDYGPDARVTKSLASKKVVLSTESIDFITTHSIDTLSLVKLIKNADVNFSKSEARKKPCGFYHLESSINKKDYILKVENCKKVATVKSIAFDAE